MQDDTTSLLARHSAHRNELRGYVSTQSSAKGTHLKDKKAQSGSWRLGFYTEDDVYMQGLGNHVKPRAQDVECDFQRARSEIECVWLGGEESRFGAR